jgi:multidrug resistance efflux pump
VESLTEQLGKRQAEARLSALDDRLQQESKQAEARKKALLADKPADLVAALARQQAELDRALAAREVEFQRLKGTSNRRGEQAELAALRDQLARAEAYVQQAKDAIAKMSVKARRPGTVVWRQNWRGEKRKIGDPLYSGDSALEVAQLDRMGADGQVDEVDASVLQIPLAALRSAGGGVHVQRVRGGARALVPVKLGRRSRDHIEVLEGLGEGDRVAVDLGPGKPAASGPGGPR